MGRYALIVGQCCDSESVVCRSFCIGNTEIEDKLKYDRVEPTVYDCHRLTYSQ